MALAEALILWRCWPHFANQSLPHNVSIGDFAISPNGDWGVSQISLSGGMAEDHTINDVVLHNLRGQDAFR
jgi:hypothetical protein